MISLKFTIVGVVVTLIACTVAGIWTPSSILATDALIEARQDQMISTTVSTGDRVLGYFQLASFQVSALGTAWNYSHAGNGNDPQGVFLSTYAGGLWPLLHTPVLASVLYTWVQDENDVNCPIGRLLLSSTSMGVSGPGYRYQQGDVCTNSTVSCESNAWRHVAIRGINGDSDPLQFDKTITHYDCISLDDQWNTVIKQGDRATLDTGYRSNTWGTPFVSGLPPNDALYVQVRFPIVSTPHSLSGFGGLGIRVGKLAEGSDAVALSMQELLMEAAVNTDLDDMLFLVNREGRLYASSIVNQEVNVRDSSGALLGLTLADNSSMVAEPIVYVAKKIFWMYCVDYKCNWPMSLVGAGQLNVHGGYHVAITTLDDPNAESLGLLLAMVVKESEITGPADELTIIIAVISCVVLVVFAAVSIVLGKIIATPVVEFTQKIQRSSRMELDTLDLKKTYFLSEIQKMSESLNILVDHLVLYKSFLPTLLLDKDNTDENTELSESSRQSHKTHTAQSSKSSTVHQRRVIPQAAKKKNGTIIATNIRGYTQTKCKLSPERFEKEQTKYIEVLAKLAEKGTLDYVNGDRAIISFLKVASTGISSACANSIVLKKSDIPGMVVGISHGSITFGVMGISSYRSMQVCGQPLSIAAALVSVATVRTTDKLTIVADSDVVAPMSTRFSFIASGVIAVNAVVRVSSTSPCTQFSDLLDVIGDGEDEEWMYKLEAQEDGKKAIIKYGEAFYRQALKPDETTWEEFKSCAAELLVKPDPLTVEHITCISSCSTEFARLCVFGNVSKR